MKDFAISYPATGTVAEVAVRLRRAVEAAKWGILGGYDFGEILDSKGYPQNGPIRTLDVCAPAHAAQMLGQEKLIGLCLPCSILIYDEAGQATIASVRPSAIIGKLFPQSGLEEYVAGIDQELESILDSAAKG